MLEPPLLPLVVLDISRCRHLQFDSELGSVEHESDTLEMGRYARAGEESPSTSDTSWVKIASLQLTQAVHVLT